ncbi:FAD-dependent monooxygenase [Sphingomonas sp. MMSM20]|uniref:FAD-dependent monooxygenase n=1 Tax=Sphingomonas lycopersici TaxID=2951807 RepID=UPI002237B381|nr:FAD-dependent monooxygenase [Sphingomonas lycopersici]MCW6530827.1 FAD-dependent monooxygenase [Sphingomonas lycopersici]
MKTRIGIVGAGFAGLGLALALARRGFAPTVIEKRSEEQLLNEGIFLTLAPNGMNALRGLGLADAALARGIETRGLVFHNEHGRVLGALDYTRHVQRFAAPSVTIPRGELGAILLEAARAAGIAIRFGTAVDAVTQTSSDLLVTGSDGGGERFDILVGADGLRSRVRRLAMPDLPAPAYNGLQGSGGIVDMPDVPPTDGLMHMTFGRNAFFGYIKAPAAPVHWFNTFPQAEENRATPLTGAPLAQFLAGLHRLDPEVNRRIIAAVDPADIRVYPDFDIPSLSHWSLGRVVLIGDAAHAVTPHSGQGASMALEDALVLAAAIAAEPTPARAFERFESLRRARVEAAVRLGRQSGTPKKAQGWLSLRLRDLLLPLFVPLGQKAQERLFVYRVDQEPLSLP